MMDGINGVKLMQGMGLIIGEAGSIAREFEKDVRKRDFNNEYERVVKKYSGELTDELKESYKSELTDIANRDIMKDVLGADARVPLRLSNAVKKNLVEYDEFMEGVKRVKDSKVRALLVYKRYKRLPMQIRDEFLNKALLDIAKTEGLGSAESYVVNISELIKKDEDNGNVVYLEAINDDSEVMQYKVKKLKNDTINLLK